MTAVPKPGCLIMIKYESHELYIDTGFVKWEQDTVTVTVFVLIHLPQAWDK
jgi:hypothetical protein